MGLKGVKRAMQTNIERFEGFVSFRNSQGAKGQGSLLHVTRSSVVIEVYNPFSLVQLSEVLTEVEIRRGSRVIYDGTAIVSNITATGLYDIITIFLRDPWKDLHAPMPGLSLQREVDSFVKEWEYSIKVAPPYRIAVNNIKDFLSSLSQWLGQLEMAVGIEKLKQSPALQREFCEDIYLSLASTIDALMQDFEYQGRQLEQDVVSTHKAFAQRELHALVMCSPFCHRTYTKPLGYAGDYEMVNMLLRDPWEGANIYAKVVNSILIQSDTAQAHRNRIVMLEENIKREAKRVASQGKRCKILNVGCGPAAEVERFILNEDIANNCDITLIDFNKETLYYAKMRLNAAKKSKKRYGTKLSYKHSSISELLKMSSERKEPVEAAYDLVYCAGLFDYLKTAICKRVVRLFYHYTLREGIVIVTNVLPKHPVKVCLEHILEWYLILRDTQDMLQLAPESSVSKVLKDKKGVNIFLKLRKTHR